METLEEKKSESLCAFSIERDRDRDRDREKERGGVKRERYITQIHGRKAV